MLEKPLSREKIVSISSLKPGDCGRVISFLIDSDFRRKLLGLGVYPGARVRVLRWGPFGNPMEILVDDTLTIAIRRREASYILVEICDEET